jgi:hypothetical protein
MERVLIDRKHTLIGPLLDMGPPSFSCVATSLARLYLPDREKKEVKKMDILAILVDRLFIKRSSEGCVDTSIYSVPFLCAFVISLITNERHQV